MIVKVHYQTDQEELLRACDGVMYQMFEDRFVKSAASDLVTRDMLKEHAPDKDHFMIHLVGMGDYENYGPNKNFDAFPKAALEKYAHTFVTNGCLFREHRNRDQATQGIGQVKYAAYSPDMHRVEIVVHGHREKAAAEYEKAKNGEPLSFSMSCRVPEDYCSCCHHAAKKQASYCQHLKHSMGQYIPEFRKYAYAINNDPTFFDISVVAKPADRIAHYLEYAFPDEETRVKAASDNLVITGADWARYEGVSIQDDEDMVWTPDKRAVLEKLASAESYLSVSEEELSKHAHAKNPREYFAVHVAPHAFDDRLSDEAVEALRSVEPGELCGELAKRASLLPFPEFASYVLGIPRSRVLEDPAVKLACCSKLPGIFGKLMSGGPCGMGSMFDASEGTGASEGDMVQDFMDSVEEKFNIRTEPVRNRVIQIITIKMAGERDSSRFIVTDIPYITQEHDSKAQALAEAYGIYKVSALRDMGHVYGHDLDDMQYLLAASQNKHIYR